MFSSCLSLPLASLFISSSVHMVKKTTICWCISSVLGCLLLCYCFLRTPPALSWFQLLDIKRISPDSLFYMSIWISHIAKNFMCCILPHKVLFFIYLYQKIITHVRQLVIGTMFFFFFFFNSQFLYIFFQNIFFSVSKYLFFSVKHLYSCQNTYAHEGTFIFWMMQKMQLRTRLLTKCYFNLKWFVDLAVWRGNMGVVHHQILHMSSHWILMWRLCFISVNYFTFPISHSFPRSIW